ncbi:MAG: RNA polymerase-binding protein DksA [Alphaproteobacteria bacterium]|nr:RNA polymerase-binding protein DksA [Alphaproteobacteria bacterium]
MAKLMDELRMPQDYFPLEDNDYMGPKMLAYFRKKLLDWKADLLSGSSDTIHTMQAETHEEPDIADRASTETDRAIELRARDRERKLISKIDEALQRIMDGEYGYCEETGEPIGVARLEARPIATLSIDAQERHERKERTQVDVRV